VPLFSKNLISLFRLLLDNPHLLIEFSSSLCVFKDRLTNQTLLQVTCSRGLFFVTLPFPSTPLPQDFIGIRASADLWHARLGHPSNVTTL
jgi:hypothetical protein